MESLKSVMESMKFLDSDLKSDICSKCGEDRIEKKTLSADHPLGPGTINVRVMCKCESKEYREKEEQTKREEAQRRIDRLREYSLMGASFKEDTFDSFIIDADNRMTYELGKRYVNKWQELKKENIGLLLHGSTGVGKTFLTNCIANELIDRYVTVVSISTINLINRVYDSYGKWGEGGEVQIINHLNSADLLIIDDLGAEHEHEKGKQIVYSLIDTRIRSNRPLIITTNLEINELQEHLTGKDGVARTMDRITEVCIPVKIKGSSKRKRIGDKKADKARKMLFG